MKKTLTINLGGIVFHIDEDAYDLLRSYLEKLKVRFHQESASEIISDIEYRMAEMFNEQKSFDRYVISKENVQHVIDVMGNPDDIAGEEKQQDTDSSQYTQNTTYKNSNRRIFRNPDDKILGGVCSGISAYFNIDPVWLRLIIALTVVFAGTGIMVYIILWIIIPEASTPLEKMQMRGEELNISNIERSIKNEMEGVKSRMESLGKDLKSESNKYKVRNGIQRMFGELGAFLMYIIKTIGLLIGTVFSFAAIVLLATLSIILFMALGWIPASDASVIGHQFLTQILSSNQLTMLSIGILVVVSLPVLVLLLNGLKLLFKVNLNLKKIGAVLSAFWIIGIFIVVYQAVDISKDFNRKAVVSSKEPLSLSGKKHLLIKANQLDSENDHLEGGFNFRLNNNRNLFYFTEKSDSVLCSDLRLDVGKSMNDSVYLVLSYSSRGRTIEQARSLASDCIYNYSIIDSVLILDDVFNLNQEKKYRGQQLRLTLKVPETTILTFDQSLRGIVYYMEDTPNNLESDMIPHTWKMKSEGLECLDCNEEKDRQEPIIDNEL